MHDTSWITPALIIGPMLFAMAALFIAISIHTRRAAQRGTPPGEGQYQATQTRASSRQGSNSPTNQMSKSGAQLIAPGESKTRFTDVAGCNEAKEELQEIVQYLLEPGIFQEMGAKIPKGVLLVGPPGTGKTLLAKAVAGESKASFMAISGPNFVEMFVGVGASRVRDLFAEARKNAPCIIFIDEIDAVGRKRSNSPNSNDERENTLNQLLVELDGFAEVAGIVVIAATNRSDILDPALIRPGRFDRHINVDLPDRAGRQAIFAVHARNKPVDESVDMAELARITPGFSGAEIEGVCNEAATVAARRILKLGASSEVARRILPHDFDEGLLRVQIGVALGSRTKGYTREQLFNTSVHEVGHGWVSEALEGGSPVNRITILARSSSLGHMMAVSDTEDTTLTALQIRTKISVMLAGRIAQEEILGAVDSGAQSDFSKASSLARQYVVSFGMSDLGAAAAGADEETTRMGPKFADEIDDAVRELIKACDEVARAIVARDAGAMKALAELLLEKETMLKDEWRDAKASVVASVMASA